MFSRLRGHIRHRIIMWLAIPPRKTPCTREQFQILLERHGEKVTWRNEYACNEQERDDMDREVTAIERKLWSWIISR